MIGRCKSVLPDAIHWNYKMGDKCYEKIPVTVRGNLWFLSDGSNDLVHSSLEIPCQHAGAAVFISGHREDGSPIFRTEAGSVKIQRLNTALTPLSSQQPYVSFHAPAVFNRHLYAGPNSLQLIYDYMSKTEILERKLYSLADFSSQFTMDPSFLHRAFNLCESKVGAVVAAGTHELRHIWHETRHGATSVVSWISRAVAQFVWNVVTMLLVCGTLIFIGYQSYLLLRFPARRARLRNTLAHWQRLRRQCRIPKPSRWCPRPPRRSRRRGVQQR